MIEGGTNTIRAVLGRVSNNKYLISNNFLLPWLPSVYNDTLSDNQLTLCLTNKTSIRPRLYDRLKEKFLKL